MRLIGIDCATNERNVGIALAVLDDSIRVREVFAGIRRPWDQAADWLVEPGERNTLIAIDAPLGWPQPLAEALRTHKAGSAIRHAANELFRRSTDLHIRQRTGKQPLDVGADRIARTAHAALSAIQLLSEKTGVPIPLVWNPGDVGGTHVIEVYPAATLKVHGMPYQAYKDGKNSEHRLVRKEILSAMPGLRLPDACRAIVLDNADALDAVVCLLAAGDFVRGECMRPEDPELAHREGWIWCRAPDAINTGTG